MTDPFKDVYKSCRKFEKTFFPRMIDVELTNNCNLACSMCPTGNKTAKRKKGFMSGNVWHLILKELVEHKTPVRFVRWGEPTLHKNLYDWVSEAKEEGLLTHINTNGINLDIEEALDCGLDSIKFSIHKEVPETLTQLSKSHNRPYISAHYYGTSPPAVLSKNVLSFMPYGDEIRQMPVKDLTRPPDMYIKCSEVYNRLSVNWDGTVSACCADYDNLMIVGDIKNTSLEYIWNSTDMAEYRRRLDRLEHERIPLCRNCSREML